MNAVVIEIKLASPVNSNFIFDPAKNPCIQRHKKRYCDLSVFSLLQWWSIVSCHWLFEIHVCEVRKLTDQWWTSGENEWSWCVCRTSYKTHFDFSLGFFSPFFGVWQFGFAYCQTPLFWLEKSKWVFQKIQVSLKRDRTNLDFLTWIFSLG